LPLFSLKTKARPINKGDESKRNRFLKLWVEEESFLKRWVEEKSTPKMGSRRIRRRRWIFYVFKENIADQSVFKQSKANSRGLAAKRPQSDYLFFCLKTKDQKS
jgi:hypothetical protein